jgi:BolA protein
MRVAKSIEQKLNAGLTPDKLTVEDESAQHQGHAGARPQGESHFRVTIVSAKFEGLGRIERQRMVYRLLAEDMQSDIHALTLTTLTPAEDAERTEFAE